MFEYTTSRRLRGLRGALLDLIIAGPPNDAGERWFCADLARFSQSELRDEARRLRLRLLLTPPREHDWPTTWLAERLQRIDAMLGAAAKSARVRRHA